MAMQTYSRLKPKCPCGIKAYSDEASARRALMKVQNLRLRDAMPKGVVECFWGQWHLGEPRSADTGPDRNTRNLIEERDEYRCARCGKSVYGIRASIHHRRNRASGGSSDPAINSPANLLLVCGDGTTDCHGWIGANLVEAGRRGFVVSTNSKVNPADVPVEHAVHGWVLLRPDGKVWPIPSGGAA